MWLSFLALHLIATAVTASPPECPPSKDIYPCFCDSDQFLSFVSCRGFNSIDRVKPVVENARGYNVSFGFWKSRLGDIPSDLFAGHHTQNMHFENCKIGSFGTKPFSGLEHSLKRIYIYGSIDKRERDLETFPLAHLTKLEELVFQANDIKRLGNDWFNGGPHSLQQLNLEANDIEELGDRAFASLVNLEQIWLGDNTFRKVSRSMFPRPAKRLWYLEMSFNGIEVLPEDIFSDMPVLTNINVSGNKLKSVPQATWGNIWPQLKEVYFERNSGFQCDENLKWIYQQKLPKILTGNCGWTNNKLNGKKLEDIKLEDFE